MTERPIRRDPYADPRDPYIDADDEPGYEPAERRRGISPVAIFLVIAIVGSIAYMAFVVTVREATQIPLLASGAVVLAIVFGALAAFCLRTIWRAGLERGNAGRTILTALVGGGAAIAASGFAAGAIVLFQLAARAA
ncbi:MAG TPA: hypothetical protein VHK05_06065 [Candidatus Limnocylindrales bacterium]|jgi:hypothetical protein|nr:hypothetical protein [Candidatus Limnocylindrales bacterium]